MRQAEFSIRINEMVQRFVEDKLQPFTEELAEQGIVPFIEIQCGVMFTSPEAAEEFNKSEADPEPVPLEMSDEQFLSAVGVRPDGADQ